MDPNICSLVKKNIIVKRILEILASIDTIIPGTADYSDIHPELKPYVDIILQDDMIKPYSRAITKIATKVDKDGRDGKDLNVRFLYMFGLAISLRSNKSSVASISKLVGWLSDKVICAIIIYYV